MNIKYLVLALFAFGKAEAQQSNYSCIGITDFHGLLKSIPILPSTTEAAFDFAFSKDINASSSEIMAERYEVFNKKMELFSKQFQVAHASTAQSYGEKGREGLYYDSKRQANQNDIISEMGGIDNIQQMTEEQQRSAAINAAAGQVSNLAFSPFTEDEVKRMMNDPDYAQQMAEKYKNLSDHQKAELLKNQLYVTGSNTIEQTESSHKEFEKLTRKGQSAKDIMKVNLFVAGLHQKIEEALNNYSSKMKLLREESYNHSDLDQDYEIDYKTIPIVVVGEGRDHDPVLTQKLRVDYALKHKTRAALELLEAEKEYHKLLTEIEQLITDYESFVNKNKYKVNGTISDELKETNTELSLIQAEQKFGETIAIIGQISYDETLVAANHERWYQYVIAE